MENKIGYRDLLSEKNYLKNFAANMINRFGDAIDALAFSWMVYAVTGNPVWSAVIFGLNSLPTIVLMPFAGVLVERYNRKHIMVIADIGRAALVTLVATLYITNRINPWILAATTLLMSTFEAFRIPAGLSIYPEIVPREKYTVATSLSQSCTSVFTMLGTGAFGLIVAVGGLGAAMLVNAATFVCSALLVSQIRLGRRKKPAAPMSAGAYFADLKDGFAYLWRKKVIAFICLAGAAVSVLFVPLEALKAPYIREVLGQGEAALSIMSVCVMAGSMAGTALFPYINRRVSKARLFLAAGFTLTLAYAAYPAISLAGAATVLPLLGAVSLLYGFGTSFLNVVVSVAFMQQIEGAYIGRVGAIFNSLASVLVPPASFLVAGAINFFTINQVFLVFGLLNLILYSGLGRSKTLRAIDGDREEGSHAIQHT